MMLRACTPCHERCDGCIDQSVPSSCERPLKVSATARHGSATSRAPAWPRAGAIVNDFKRERHQLTFQYEAQLLNSGGRHWCLLRTAVRARRTLRTTHQPGNLRANKNEVYDRRPRL